MAENKPGIWKRLNRWVDGDSPAPAKAPEPAPEQAPPARYAPPPKKRHNPTFYERFLDWELSRSIPAFNRLYKVMSCIICCAIIGILLVTVSTLPKFGDPANPTNNAVSEKYIVDGLKDTGATNVVAAIILDYRAFDTFGESSVLFLASCAVITLLREDDRKKRPDAFSREMNEPRHDLILAKVSQLLIPFVFVFGVYIVLNGHLSPGGGFSGGTVLGASLILYLSAYGAGNARRFFGRKTYLAVTSIALGFYAAAKSYSFYTGANHIESVIPKGTPGAILSSGLILPLNICVGMVVACTMYGFYQLFSKGDI